tara:strand:+ start:3961 stop:7806 length:3846 start_codon:yes stop_codon:yes gene_type:complete
MAVGAELSVKISFPDALPVSRRRDDIREALTKHQVVIVCGDTGSGKTTQLPKIALEMGRGVNGKRIGCTQPRRIAATSVARRVAEELEVPLGKEVGYQIRFEDRTERNSTAVKFMTDGVLLAESRHDRDLRQYDTLIIDEAHERSLNIDFILGYLYRTLKRRKDLKIVISSATLDAGSFSKFFGDAPVIEVEGRTFPVEDEYQDPLHDRERLSEQVARAVEELGQRDRLGDTLVFLPGEREIRDAADLLEGRKYADTLVLPLFARQAGKEQQAVFQPMEMRRRLILATNVAETSLTIPGIRFVVDSGIARVSRHDSGSGIQRLQIEPISKASARQRRGRCGRISEGVCVRLYSEEDFNEREEFTDPEILRSNLTGVVLQMEHLGLGDPLEFPFVDPPQPKRVAQAYRVLDEIGAIQKHGSQFQLTKTGQSLARLPVDPRVGRILVAAKEENCLEEGLIVASALTVQDPKERPKEKQEAADSAHGQFKDKRSDFTSWLRWWFAIHEARKKSNNELRRFCQKNFLNFRRVQEWMNLHRELRDCLREMKWRLPAAKRVLADPEDTYSEALHRAVLAAIPSQIGIKNGQKPGYKGARNSEFYLFPGSGVFKTSPSWTMAFEIVETAKLYARNAAIFDPGWVEQVAPHLCRYRYSNPQWDPDQGAVYGQERVIAFGLPVVDKRPVHYGRIDRKVAREVFLLEALVNGNTRAPIPALARNRETIAAAERLEHKMRRHGGLVHPEAIVSFYEERLPEAICTQKDFAQWVAGENPGVIDFTLDDCLLPQVEPLRVEHYPDSILSVDGATELSLYYLHNPSEEADGMTLEVPLVELPHLPAWFGEWLVTGWLDEKVASLLRCLRKETRTLLPANREVLEGFVGSWEGYEPHCGLLEALVDFFRENYRVEITVEAFDLKRLPSYLQMRYAIVDDQEKVIAAGRDLSELQERLSGQLRDRFKKVSQGRFERDGIRAWNFGDLPSEVELDRHTKGFPRLFDDGSGAVAMKLWPSAVCAGFQHRLGAAKLFRLEKETPVNGLESVIFGGKEASPVPQPSQPKPQVAPSSGFGSLAAAFGETSKAPSRKTAPNPSPKSKSSDLQYLASGESWLLSNIGPDPSRNKEDLLRRALNDLIGEPLEVHEWNEAQRRTEAQLFERLSNLCGTVRRILRVVETINGLLENSEPGYEESLADAREHFNSLLAPGWLLTGSLVGKLVHWQGLELRLTRMLGSAPIKDLQKLERYQEKAAVIWKEEGICECGQCPEAVAREKWLEEDWALRLHTFAPEIKARLK